MLNTHQNVFTSDKCSVGKTSWEEFKIELVPGARPVNQRVRPLPPPLKENLREQLDKWLKDEVIEQSNSPWSSPLVPVTKKSGTIRWVLDFCAVNSVTVADSYPYPNISNILSSLGKSTFFSKLDVSSVYNVIPVAPESRPITAFATNHKTTSKTRLIYLLEDEFESEPKIRIVIPPSHRYQAMLAVHVTGTLGCTTHHATGTKSVLLAWLEK